MKPKRIRKKTNWNIWPITSFNVLNTDCKIIKYVSRLKIDLFHSIEKKVDFLLWKNQYHLRATLLCLTQKIEVYLTPYRRILSTFNLNGCSQTYIFTRWIDRTISFINLIRSSVFLTRCDLKRNWLPKDVNFDESLFFTKSIELVFLTQSGE